MSKEIYDVKRKPGEAIAQLCDLSWMFCKRPGVDFTRNRKLPFRKVITLLLSMEGGTLATELLRYFGCSPDTASSSALIQQRSKIDISAFTSLFDLFVQKTTGNRLYRGLRLLAADGSDIQVPTDSNDPDSCFPGSNSQAAYTVGLLHFHAKKVEYIYQEVFAGPVMYNFTELVTSHVIIRKADAKYAYKANFAVAVHVCRQFYLGNVSPPDVEALIRRHISPIRPGRSRPRKMTVKHAVSFIYRKL